MAATPADPRAIVEHMLGHDAFSRWLGLEVLRVEPGAVEVRMVVRDEMTNGFRVAHGAIAFALADSALAFAANTRGRVALSVETQVSYVAPVRPGDVLHAAAREQTCGRRRAIYDATVTRDGEVVALVRGTVHRTDEVHEPS